MTIQDEAAKIIGSAEKGSKTGIVDIYGVVASLAAAGLLREELPEPDWTGGVTTWETAHGDIELISGEMIDTPGAYMTTHEAREYAHALLAAAKYAEEGK